MFRLPFARRTDDPDVDEVRDADEMWPLPDMEPPPPPNPVVEERPASFQFEELEVHPRGTFPAELTEWRPLPGQRAAWTFETLPDGTPGGRPRRLEFVTGTVFRSDNNLCRLLTALRSLEPADCSAADTDAGRAALAARLSMLEPDSLLGRRCLVEVEHSRDDLGNVTARIHSVAPL
jgi:hypothetical protein